jgi:protein tyrosine/serine phosphatase
LSASEPLDTVAGVERILAWDGALNARDTGGLKTRDGHVIRHGALVRSDVLTRLTESGREALVAHGVRTIVDVRMPNELEEDDGRYPFATTDPDTSTGSVTYRHVPFNAPLREGVAAEELRQRYQAAQSREELNRLDLDINRDGIAAIVAAIADAGPGGVLVHCHAGKDRTGMIVALALSLAGVDDDQIADDYALTALNLDPLIIDWLDEMSDDETERARLRKLAEPRREAMLDTLAYLRERHGGAEAYLLNAGVARAKIARLRQRLVESNDG